MRYLLLIALYLSPMSVFADEEISGSDVKMVLVEYSKVAAAWQIDKNCNFLSAEQAKNLDSHSPTITLALKGDFGDMKILLPILQSAKDTSNNEPYRSCRKQEELFVYSLALRAENWVNLILAM